MEKLTLRQAIKRANQNLGIIFESERSRVIKPDQVELESFTCNHGYGDGNYITIGNYTTSGATSITLKVRMKNNYFSKRTVHSVEYHLFDEQFLDMTFEEIQEYKENYIKEEKRKKEAKELANLNNFKQLLEAKGLSYEDYLDLELAHSKLTYNQKNRLK